MNLDDMKGSLRAMPDGEFERILEAVRTDIRGGDVEAIAELQQRAIEQIVLRLASLMPDDPMVTLCVRVLNQDLEAMIEINDAIMHSLRRGP